MSLALQFSEQSFEISTDGGATYKPLVCLQSADAGLELPTTEEDTNCGSYTGLGVLKQSVSLECVCEAEPTASQVTWEDVAGYMKARTLLTYRYQNAATGSVTAGGAFYFQGEGYFTTGELTGTTGEVIKFTAEFNAIGDIDVTAP